MYLFFPSSIIVVFSFSFSFFVAWLQALNRVGLRIVLDVVYNHLHGSGPFDVNSVLDKVVDMFIHLPHMFSVLLTFA